MQRRPFQHQSQRPARQRTAYHPERPNINHRLKFGIERMKMRRSMINLEHLNQDTVERAEGRQI